jgi:hypothetical protein
MNDPTHFTDALTESQQLARKSHHAPLHIKCSELSIRAPFGPDVQIVPQYVTALRFAGFSSRP